MFTIRNMGGVALFLSGTTFLWLTPSFASPGMSTTGTIWAVTAVLALATLAGFMVATWGLFRKASWWAGAAVAATVLGVAVLVPYWLAARRAGETNPEFNVVIHGLGDGRSMRTRFRPNRVALAAYAGFIALSAYFGSIGMISGLLPVGASLAERLPFHSPVFAGFALALIVGLPTSFVAALSWRRHPRTPDANALAGLLVVGWIAVPGPAARGAVLGRWIPKTSRVKTIAYVPSRSPSKRLGWVRAAVVLLVGMRHPSVRRRVRASRREM